MIRAKSAIDHRGSGETQDPPTAPTRSVPPASVAVSRNPRRSYGHHPISFDPGQMGLRPDVHSDIATLYSFHNSSVGGKEVW